MAFTWRVKTINSHFYLANSNKKPSNSLEPTGKIDQLISTSLKYFIQIDWLKSLSVLIANLFNLMILIDSYDLEFWYQLTSFFMWREIQMIFRPQLKRDKNILFLKKLDKNPCLYVWNHYMFPNHLSDHWISISRSPLM